MAAAPSSSSPPRRTALLLRLLLVVSLLLLLLSVAAAARAVPAASSRNQQEQYRDVYEEKAIDEGRCGGVRGGDQGEDEEVECLMRRMLVAHTDYIYTQQQGAGGHN